LAGGHLTAEALGALAAADDVFYLTADPASETALLARRPDARSLADCYAPGRRRERSYAAMLRRIAAPLARGRTVCAAFYGHPGVFAWAPHEAIARARAQGHEARMLPSVSAEDCLFADLELDPAALGWQSFEASDFLLRPRRCDPASALVLWQIGAVGVADYRRRELWSRGGLRALARRLLETYPADHEVVLYEAAQYAVCAPRVERRPLGSLGAAPASVITTLLVPPAARPALDRAELRALGWKRAAPTRSVRASPRVAPARLGRLSIVGLGYGAGAQVTLETRALLADASRVHYLVSDAATAAWLRTVRADAASLADAYRDREPGSAASARMVRRLLGALAGGHDVCAAFSGHPALYLHTAHAALRAARRRGFEAQFYPAVSCEDCLFADLGLDPASHGRLLYEATDFVMRPRAVDPTALLVLLQVGALGESAFRRDGSGRRRGLARLHRRLAAHFPPDQELVLYRSARLPWLEPERRPLTLAELPSSRPAVDATLVVVPRARAALAPDAVRELGVSRPRGPSARRSARSAGSRGSDPRPDSRGSR
jgi:uncharacterized protein YabN with tetrapyrrole methylase and pyrophosphatase domain